MPRLSLPTYLRISSAVALVFVLNCTEHTPSPPDIASPTPYAPQLPAASLTCDVGNGGITLPPGFCAIIVADQVGLARHVGWRAALEGVTW